MQKDFHYCCIKCLSRVAGFPEDEAQVIAYASQYVDDATEHKGIQIEGVPDAAKDLVMKGRFEPVCTAHSGIQYISGLKKDVQLKVYVPFHFIPREPYDAAGAGLYDYRVKADSPLVKSIMSEAVLGYKNARSEGDDARLGALIKLGIALHSYADSWSHDRFSGRWSAADNDIERLRILDGGQWKELGLIERILYDLSPSIGHAEAMNMPDQSHLAWRYEHDASGINVTSENSEKFLEAAGTIYNVLCLASDTQPCWKTYVNDVKDCLCLPTDSVKEKFKRWANAFPDVSFYYSPRAWRMDALDGDRYDWDHFQSAEDFETLSYKAKGDLKWFLFHLEAKKQRIAVTRQIRADLL